MRHDAFIGVCSRCILVHVIDLQLRALCRSNRLRIETFRGGWWPITMRIHASSEAQARAARVVSKQHPPVTAELYLSVLHAALVKVPTSQSPRARFQRRHSILGMDFQPHKSSNIHHMPQSKLPAVSASQNHDQCSLLWWTASPQGSSHLCLPPAQSWLSTSNSFLGEDSARFAISYDPSAASNESSGTYSDPNSGEWQYHSASWLPNEPEPQPQQEVLAVAASCRPDEPTRYHSHTIMQDSIANAESVELETLSNMPERTRSLTLDMPAERASDPTSRETEVELHSMKQASSDGLRGHIANISEHGMSSGEELEFAAQEKTLLDTMAIRTIDQFESRVIQYLRQENTLLKDEIALLKNEISDLKKRTARRSGRQSSKARRKLGSACESCRQRRIRCTH